MSCKFSYTAGYVISFLTFSLSHAELGVHLLLARVGHAASDLVLLRIDTAVLELNGAGGGTIGGRNVVDTVADTTEDVVGVDLDEVTLPSAAGGHGAVVRLHAH